MDDSGGCENKNKANKQLVLLRMFKNQLKTKHSTICYQLPATTTW